MDYLKRIHSFQRKIADFNCDAFLVEDKVNLYYLTGLSLSAGTLLMHKEGAHLFVDGRYLELCENTAPCPVLLSSKVSVASFISSEDYKFIKSIGFDAETTSFQAYLEWKKRLEIHEITLVPVDNPVKQLRMIKDSEEIILIQEAARLGSMGYDFVCSLLREGVKESELAAELEIFWKRMGAKGVAFEPIIAFGTNGSMPHYRSGHTALQKGMSILIDIGVNDRNYHSDMTRVVFFGEPDPEIKKIHAIVCKAQQMAIELCKPGTLIGDLDKAARGYITEQGYGEYFNHSLGHGVGLEIHEAPWLRNVVPYSKMLLQAGMVITIEPGIYLKGIGGVRIEDTVLITAKGHENLTLRPVLPAFIS